MQLNTNKDILLMRKSAKCMSRKFPSLPNALISLGASQTLLHRKDDLLLVPLVKHLPRTDVMKSLMGVRCHHQALEHLLHTLTGLQN